ncbi:MAG: hypothetical protein ACJ8FM_18520, partial [Xanthobacteraceae bacterium]
GGGEHVSAGDHGVSCAIACISFEMTAASCTDARPGVRRCCVFARGRPCCRQPARRLVEARSCRFGFARLSRLSGMIKRAQEADQEDDKVNLDFHFFTNDRCSASYLRLLSFGWAVI